MGLNLSNRQSARELGLNGDDARNMASRSREGLTAKVIEELLAGVAGIAAGLAILPEGRRRRELEALAAAIFAEEFEGRVLPFDVKASAAYADIFAMRGNAGRPAPPMDLLIAAIALSRRQRGDARRQRLRRPRPHCDQSLGHRGYMTGKLPALVEAHAVAPSRVNTHLIPVLIADAGESAGCVAGMVWAWVTRDCSRRREPGWGWGCYRSPCCWPWESPCWPEGA